MIAKSIYRYYERLRSDAAYRRTIGLLFMFLLALSAEVLLLSIDLPRHRDVVLHTVVSAAVILLPFTMIAVGARLPAGKRFVKRRFIVRPFSTIKSKSEYDGNAIASLLYREIVAWRSSARGRSGGYSVPPASVSLGIASLPLDWLWTQIRYLLTSKKDIVIDGLLIDSDPTLKLKVWTSDSEYTWEAALGEGPFHEVLKAAISQLTPDILESLDPVHLARIRHGQWNYDEAIRLLAPEDSSWKILLELAGVYLEAEYLMQAQRHLEKLQSRATSGNIVDIDLLSLQTELLMRIGEFRKAQDLLLEALKHQKFKSSRAHLVYWWLANSYVYERNYDQAVEAYNQAQQRALAELARLLGEKSVDDLASLYDRRLHGKLRDEVLGILSTLHDIANNRSRCRKLLDDALGDLSYSRNAVELILFFDVSAGNYLQAAVTAKAMAIRHLENNDSGAFDEAIRNALDLYDSAIRLFDESLTDTGEDIRSEVDLAWSYFGKASCLIRKSLDNAENHAGDPVAQAADRLMRIFLAFSDQNRNTFATRFRRIRELARTGSDKYPEHLRKAATGFVEALIADFDPNALDETSRDVEALQLPESSKIGGDPHLPAQKLSGPEENVRDPEEVARLSGMILRLLHALATYQDQDQLDKWLNAAELDIQTGQCIERSTRLFDDLNRRASKRLRAEAFYGFACLAAIDNDASLAATYLRLASDSAGEHTRAYLNRSLLDEDFDSVRKHPDFEGLFSTGLPAPKSADTFYASSS